MKPVYPTHTMTSPFLPFPELRTHRILLRRPTLADAPDLYAHRADAVVNRYLEQFRHDTPAQTEDFLRRIDAHIHGGESLYWILSGRKDGAFLGTLCLWNFSPDRTEAETGFTLQPEYHGKGYMREALSAVLDFGFQALHLRAIHARTHRDNAAAIRLLQGAGFMSAPSAEVGDMEVAFVLCRTSDQ